ncbi:hypothetical protein C8D84_10366 [Psychrobacter immobilis]|uniref:Uncharacterized protein n=1 Tax=Psychrobacter immobilis TaxID=498 RepID=A0A2V2A4F4_PSYIM|nr:hypothetical protein C8D84_10366 [Psychrobacter immobilis]
MMQIKHLKQCPKAKDYCMSLAPAINKSQINNPESKKAPANIADAFLFITFQYSIT